LDNGYDNKEYSRPPTIDDLILLCQLLNEAGAKYIIIGGFAVIYHGYTRGTGDIDLLIDVSEENVNRIKEALLALPDRASKDLKFSDVIEYTVVRIADEFVIGLLASACQIDYEHAKQYIVYKEIKGVKMPFAGIDILIKMKKGIRPKDKEDLLFLKRLKEKGS
jgi:hypothetical protein